MDKEKIFENYKVSKMNFQMVEAFLEDVIVEKSKDTLDDDYKNEVNFETRYEQTGDSEYKGFLKTTVLCRNEDTDAIELQIEVIYSGTFRTAEQLNEFQMDVLVDAQIVPQLLSYCRSIITHLTSLMGITPILLPTIDVIESLANNNQLTDDEE
jgi:preprotein translocase subunit SecB